MLSHIHSGQQAQQSSIHWRKGGVVAASPLLLVMLVATTNEEEEQKRYVIVKECDEKSSNSTSVKPGDHVGGSIVFAGTSTSRRGHVYGGEPYFSCCGVQAQIDGYKRFDRHDYEYYSLEPCTRGKDGMYHPGKLIPSSYGSRRRGGLNFGGSLRWDCCGASVRVGFGVPPPLGCTVLKKE